MSFTSALVAIVAILAFTAIRIATAKGPASAADAPPPGPDERDREIAELRERVKVLERIVTDSDGRDARAIAREIENLRDR